MKKVFIALNPKSGRLEVDNIQKAIQDHFQRKSWEYELYMTTGQEQDRDIIEEATRDGFNCLIAAGGDGTVSGVAECLVGKDIPLGILPTGTGNGIARALSIPLELDRALQVITQGTNYKNLDAMELGGRHFFLMIGIGLSATALKQTQVDQKRLWGRLYYFLIALKAYFGFHPHHFHIDMDGKSYSIRGSEILLLNCGTLGDQILQWEGDILVDDGEIDVYTIRAKTIYDYLRLAWNMISGQEREDPCISAYRMKRNINIQTGKPLPVQGDGDFIQYTPAEIKVVPQAIRVLTPK